MREILRQKILGLRNGRRDKKSMLISQLVKGIAEDRKCVVTLESRIISL